MTVEVEEGIRLRITRRFAASPKRVFRAFTDPDEVGRWMWAGMGTNPSAEIDLRIGGRFRIAIEPGEGETGWRGGDDSAMSGVYVEIDPGRRLVYTLHWEADVGYNRTGEVLDEAVIVDLEPDGDGTRMVFHHVGIPDDDVSAVEHGKGIDASFDHLESMLRSG